MKATAEIQAVPIGAGVSVRQEVQRAYDLIVASGLTCELHASSANVEEKLVKILQLIERMHEVLHKEGTVRLITFIKVETRTDRTPRLLVSDCSTVRLQLRVARRYTTIPRSLSHCSTVQQCPIKGQL